MYERDLTYKLYEYPLNLIKSTYGKHCPESAIKMLAANIDSAFELMKVGEKNIEPKIRAIKLRYIDKKSLKDIGTKMNITPERVRQILHIAQCKLRNDIYSNIVFASM